MIIKCDCGEIIDLRTQPLVLLYIAGGPIKCPKCKKDIYFKKEGK